MENYLGEPIYSEDSDSSNYDYDYDPGDRDPDDCWSEASFIGEFREYEADSSASQLEQSIQTAIEEGRLKDLKKLIDSSTLPFLSRYNCIVHALSSDQRTAAKLILQQPSQRPDQFYENLLELGVRLRNEKVVKLLLDEGVDVHTPLPSRRSNNTSIHIAVQKECSQIVERLLIGGADVNSRFCYDSGSHYKEHSLLHDAVQYGNETIVKLLLQFGADIDVTNHHGLTPLHTAVQKGFLEITKCLIQEGASPNPEIAFINDGYTVTTEDACTPLQTAIQNRHKEMVRLLLESEANVNAQDNHGNTVLKLAVETRCPEMVKDVLSYCPDLNDENNKAALYSAIHSMGTNDDRIILAILLQYGFSLHSEDKNNSDLLFNAVRGNFPDVTKLLLKYGADINKLYHGNDPYFTFCSSLLHVAVVRGDMNMVKLLTDYGANLDAKNTKGKTPLLFAVTLSESEMAILFLVNGARIFDNELLILAAEKINADVIKVILEKGVDVNRKVSSRREQCEKLTYLKMHGQVPLQHTTDLSEDQSETALHVAANTGRYEVVKLLLEHGAEVNSANHLNMTPLFFAAQGGHFETVKLLLENGANVTIVNRSGQTALHKAARVGNFEIVKLLIEFGATIDAEDENGNSPLFISAEANHWETVEILLKFGASVEKNVRAQLSALDIAIQNINDKVVKLLLKHGARAVESRHFESSLVIFTKEQKSEIVELLLKSGADVNSLNWLGQSVLSIATETGSEELVRLLLNYGSGKYDVKDYSEPLFISAEKGNFQIIKRLFNSGAYVNFADKVGQTALFKAAKQGQTESVQALLKYGASVNCKTSDGETPLSICAGKGYLDAVQLLLKANADVDTTDNNGRSPLYIATREGLAEIVRLLLKHGAKTEITNHYGETPLSVSASKGNLDIFKELMKSKAEVNSIDKEGKSPLYNAAREGHIEIVKHLLKNGAVIDIQTLGGETPLFISAAEGYLDIVETLLKFNAHSTEKNKELPCCSADEEDHFRSVKRLRLMKYGAATDIKTLDETTPLSVAANNGHLNIVKALLKFGAKVNSTDRNKNTPLHYAVGNNQVEITKLLLENGAETEIKNKDGETPLSVAVRRNNFNTVQILLKSGADPNSADKEGKAVIHRVYLYDNDDILELLLAHGADINFKDENGRTPLTSSLRFGNLEQLETWLKHGASIESTDNDGNRPLHLALAGFFPRIPPDTEKVKLLVDYGANVHARGVNGATPLTISARWGSLTACRILLEAGASINLTDFLGRTPLYIAATTNGDDLVKFLMDYGADIDSQTLNYVKSTLLHSDDINTDKRKLYTTEIIVQHVVRMKAGNLCENTEIMETVSRSDKIKIDKYLQKCESEVTNMISEYIHGTEVTFYEILTKNLEQLTLFAKNNDTGKILKTGVHKIKFPIYADTIKIQLRKGEVRKSFKKLIERGIKAFFLISQNDDLPYEVVEIIIGYLSSIDLRMLIDSCKPLLSLLPSQSLENLDLFDSSKEKM